MSEAYLLIAIGAFIGGFTVRLMDRLCERIPQPPLKGEWVLSVKDGKKCWIEAVEQAAEDGEEWKNGAPAE